MSKCTGYYSLQTSWIECCIFECLYLPSGRAATALSPEASLCFKTLYFMAVFATKCDIFYSTNQAEFLKQTFEIIKFNYSKEPSLSYMVIIKELPSRLQLISPNPLQSRSPISSASIESLNFVLPG